MAKVLTAKNTYIRLKQQLLQAVKEQPKLTLASVMVEGDYAADVYVSFQKKLAGELGVDFLPVKLTKEALLDEVLRKIEELNHDQNVSGIVVNKPFPSNWNEQAVFSAIGIDKDIEGVHPYNLGKVILGQPYFISPTVLSVLEFLKEAGVSLYGKEVALVGFSTIVGKPLAIILGQEFATVMITHIATYEAGRLPFYVKNADVLISAVGKPEIIKGEWIKEAAVVIDVGISKKDGKVCGDVEFDHAKEKAAYITPVPGGVGKLTLLFLFKNLLKTRGELSL